MSPLRSTEKELLERVTRYRVRYRKLLHEGQYHKASSFWPSYKRVCLVYFNCFTQMPKTEQDAMLQRLKYLGV